MTHSVGNFKQAYTRCLSASKGKLHFASHSHHMWPDVTRDAVLQYWDDSAELLDHKWDRVLGKVTQAKRHIAHMLRLRSQDSLCTAPNTHEFVCRLLSCFDPRAKLRVLTTDSEFYSFARQTQRLEEAGLADVDRIAVKPFESFVDRFTAAMQASKHDLVFFSHVFFSNGFVLPSLSDIVSLVPHPDTMVVVDGYHSFCAVPTDLSPIQDRAFYLAGCYKYAQSGEGACFMHVPDVAAEYRPINTGWFAEFGSLQGPRGAQVQYGPGAARFWGATFDASGWYRFCAVADWWQREGLDVPAVADFVKQLQRRFLLGMAAQQPALLAAAAWATPGGEVPVQELYRRWGAGEQAAVQAEVAAALQGVGSFLVFEVDDGAALVAELQARGVTVDARARAVRVGFGLYQDEDDVDALVQRML